MAVHLTEAQARQLGISKSGRSPLPTSVTAPTRKKKTRKTVPVKAAAPNRCTTCGEVFLSETAETAHNVETGHRRFEMIMPAPPDVAPTPAAPTAPEAPSQAPRTAC